MKAHFKARFKARPKARSKACRKAWFKARRKARPKAHLKARLKPHLKAQSKARFKPQFKPRSRPHSKAAWGAVPPSPTGWENCGSAPTGVHMSYVLVNGKSGPAAVTPHGAWAVRRQRRLYRFWFGVWCFGFEISRASRAWWTSPAAQPRARSDFAISPLTLAPGLG